MPYVDGFLITVPIKKLKLYRKMASLGKKIWMHHGALEYFECVDDDHQPPFGTPVPNQRRRKPGETVVFSSLLFQSKAHRNQVDAAVMQGPRIKPPAPKRMPFDMNHMCYPGFKVLVSS